MHSPGCDVPYKVWQRVLPVILQIQARWTVSLLLVTLFFFAIIAPFHKVEENFGTNFVFDVISGRDIGRFHHIEQDDWVPRSTLPFAVVGLLSRVSLFCFPWLPRPLHPRLWLGIISSVMFKNLLNAVGKHFSRNCSMVLCLLLAGQFHPMYYSSRLIINTFAIWLSIFGVVLLLERRPLHSILVLVASSFSIRLDVFPIAIGVGLDYLLFEDSYKSIWTRFFRGCLAGMAGLVIAAILSIPFDSFFYNSFPQWSEISVIYFNIFENKSHIWGEYPWHWYVTNALPRALGFPALILFAPIRWNFQVVRIFVATVVVPVLVLSLLPHKELRFIFPSIVCATCVIAIQIAQVWNRKSHRGITRFAISFAMATTAVISYVRLIASSCNYPGGDFWTAFSPFLRGQSVLPPIVLPRIFNVFPMAPAFSMTIKSSGSDHYMSTENTNCSVYNGYTSEISGFSPYLSEGIPCTISRAEDSLRPGAKFDTVDDIKGHDWIVADANEADSVCAEIVAVTYSFERIDFGNAKIVLKPSIVACRGTR
jgi:alpha-1,6-mannosyltransferase